MLLVLGEQCQHLHSCEEENLCTIGQVHFQALSSFKSMFSAVMLSVSLVDHSLLVKLFYGNKVNVSYAIRIFQRIRNLQCEKIPSNDIRAKRFRKLKDLKRRGKQESNLKEAVYSILVIYCVKFNVFLKKASSGGQFGIIFFKIRKFISCTAYTPNSLHSIHQFEVHHSVYKGSITITTLYYLKDTQKGNCVGQVNNIYCFSIMRCVIYGFYFQ